MSKVKFNCTHPVMKVIQWIEWLGLFLITLAVVIAVFQELHTVWNNQRVELHDILLLFIYLEVLSMVVLYLTSGKLPVRYPIYIAVVAIARFVILGLKDLEAFDVIWLAVAVLILTFSALALRFGHTKYPYKEQID